MMSIYQFKVNTFYLAKDTNLFHPTYHVRHFFDFLNERIRHTDQNKVHITQKTFHQSSDKKEGWKEIGKLKKRNQRPTVLGRKNYLFSKSDSGAIDNAIFYFLLESCDTVRVNAIEWLTYVLENLHDDTPTHKIVEMLPFYYKKSCE